VTDVVFDRPGDTGAQPLVNADGQVRITGANELPPPASEAIADAINDVLSTPMPPLRAAAVAAAQARDAAAGSGPGAASSGARSRPTPRGGVGLGLPYTGPTGEPIFGLTPEQRLAGSGVGFSPVKHSGVAATLEPDPRAAVPRVRRRLWLYLVIAACAIAAGVAGAVVTARATHEPAVIELDPTTPTGAANEAFEHGDLARTLQILDANKAQLETDANAQLVLGHVRAARNESGLALAAYERALTLDPELETNEKLRAALRAMAGGTQDYAVVAQAFDLWVGRTTDPEATKLVLRSAVHDDIARRKAVQPVIERRKLGDRVDWLAAYSLDLQQEATCEARREAVSKLRALGDLRAVAALERARVKGGKPVNVRGKVSYPGANGCLVDDAKMAIGYLRGLPRK
jgi:hypothetical protein